MKREKSFYENNLPLRTFNGLEFSIRSFVFETKGEAKIVAKELKQEFKNNHKINLLVRTVKGLDVKGTICYLNYQCIQKGEIKKNG